MAPIQDTGVFTYRLDLAYEGTDFRGFARQPQVRTVQGELEKVLSVVLRENMPTTCAGRTDAGVHARRQVVSLTPSRRIADEAAVIRSLNRLLPSDVRVHRLSRPRRDGAPGSRRGGEPIVTKSGRIRWPILCAGAWFWHLGFPLDIEAMNKAADFLVGTHDFASFCRAAEGRSS